jgi:uncharacterized phiE125 gp8 family phage protein
MSYWGGLVNHGTGYESWGWYGGLEVFGSLNLTQSSPAQIFVEPLTVDEVLHYMRLPLSSDQDDGEVNFIQSLISAAREQAEILQGRDLAVKQYDLNLDYWVDYRIRLRAPLQSVDLVQYTDYQGNVFTLPQVQGSTALTGYMVDSSKQPGSIVPPYNATWPTFTPLPSSAVLVRFTSGYPTTDAFWNDAGARIKIGMKLLISSWYNNRLPFEIGSSSAMEFPYAVTSCLSYGSIMRSR